VLKEAANCPFSTHHCIIAGDRWAKDWRDRGQIREVRRHCI